jgi:hypothetical protein
MARSLVAGLFAAALLMASALLRFLASPETAPVITKAGLAPISGR